MQSISGPSFTSAVGSVGTSSMSGVATMQAVNNITTALVGETSATAPTPQIVSASLSGALSSSIGSLMKSPDKEALCPDEDWAQEVLTHQDSGKQVSSEFSSSLAKQKPKLGRNGLAVPGFACPELQLFMEEDEGDSEESVPSEEVQENSSTSDAPLNDNSAADALDMLTGYFS